MTPHSPARAAGRTVLLAGAGSTAGDAVTTALLAAGARVVAIARSPGAPAPGLTWLTCDLTDPDAVARLPERVHDGAGPVDALLPLVGGWRGGGGIPGQVEEDFRAMEGAFTALRLTTLALWEDLLASDAGRLAVVSSTTVAAPRAGSASYTALKAAAEAWVRAVADAFAAATAPAPPRAAALSWRVRSLAGREQDLAHAVVGLWDVSASELNGTTTTLSERPEWTP